MIGQQHEIARLQSDFYSVSYHKVLRLLFIEIAIMFLLILAIIYVIFSQKAPPYYITTISGQIMPLIAHQ